MKRFIADFSDGNMCKEGWSPYLFEDIGFMNNNKETKLDKNSQKGY